MQAKNSNKPAKTQEQAKESIARGLVVTVPCVRGVEPAMQLPECGTKGLAVEVLEMLRPVFPGAQFYCFEVAVTEYFDACHRGLERHKDLVLSCREADQPGRVYLDRLCMVREVEGAIAQGGAL